MCDFLPTRRNGAANAGPVTVTLDATPAVDDLILVFHVDGDTTDNAMPAITGYTDVGTSEQYANGTSNDCNSKPGTNTPPGRRRTLSVPTLVAARTTVSRGRNDLPRWLA